MCFHSQEFLLPLPLYAYLFPIYSENQALLAHYLVILNTPSKEKQIIINAGKAWSKKLTSNLQEPIVVNITKETLDPKALAGTGNYFICEKSYKEFKKTLSQLSISNNKAIHNLPENPVFNLPEG